MLGSVSSVTDTICILHAFYSPAIHHFCSSYSLHVAAALLWDSNLLLPLRSRRTAVQVLSCRLRLFIELFPAAEPVRA